MSEISSHLNDKGEARMVDVSAKAVTVRVARAEGFVAISADVISLLRRGDLPKGDALAVARLAGIQAAKRTPDLIPLCHPIAIHAVDIELEIMEKGVSIKAEVRTADRTGVEMEALTSVAVAGLALIDMIKGKDRDAHITDVRVTHKSGGKSGEWNRE
ncbi:MAG: cyclic pyranopterin monophosphate synthase MoaC [Actinobacteria bacterium]|nr:MAG: cyclic pyranopterin monophosphate synthase MoaC [Actinomycetota bacterium]